MVFVLSPHYDDAALSCFSVLLQKPTVLDIFTKKPEKMSHWDYLTGSENPALRMQERAKEEAHVMQRLGVTYDELNLDRHQITIIELAHILENRIPAKSTIYAPVGIGDHPAHMLVHNAAKQLEDRELIFYADMPYAVQFGLENGSFLHIRNYWQSYLPGLKMHAQEITNSATKIEILKLYQTQYAALNTHGILEDPILMGKEYFWKS